MSCVSAAGLFCYPGSDAAFMVPAEDSLQTSPLCGRGGVFVRGRGHGGSRHSGWKRPRIDLVSKHSPFTRAVTSLTSHTHSLLCEMGLKSLLS